MKKTSLALLTMVLAGVASAEDLLTPEDHPVENFGIALATPIQTPAPNATVDIFRWNLIYSDNYGVHGCDLGLVGHSRANSSGFTLDGLADWYDFDFTGCQIAGLGNSVLGNATGFQLAGLINYTRGNFTGFQVAALNWDGASYGMQLGAININKGISSGLQLGAYNANLNEFHGWSVGAINCTDRLDGLQLGILNIVPSAGRGVQIGVFNSAVAFEGVQLGLLNLIGNGDLPIMPILNANF